MDPITLALIAGGVTGVSNIITTNMQNEANKQLWKEQTEYNTPENQMQRLKKAGLNPALAYGKGVTTNIQGAPPTMAKPDLPSVNESVSATQQIVNQDLTRKTLEANLKLADANANDAVATYEGKKRVEELTGIYPGSTDAGLKGNAQAGAISLQKMGVAINQEADRTGIPMRESKTTWQEEREKNPFYQWGSKLDKKF